MVVLAALDNHIAILHGDNARFALVSASACTGPIGLQASRLVPGEGKLADLQLATATKARYVWVIGHGIYNKVKETVQAISKDYRVI